MATPRVSSLGAPNRPAEETARLAIGMREAEKGLVQVRIGATAVRNLALEAQRLRTCFGGA